MYVVGLFICLSVCTLRTHSLPRRWTLAHPRFTDCRETDGDFLTPTDSVRGK